MSHQEKAWEFWKKVGENPLCLAPMAEINDLPFRLLCRRHGIKVCYTGMLNSFQYIQSPEYKSRMFTTCPEDHPLIAQISGKTFDMIIDTAKDLALSADAIDINLGCTQRIASRGGYGFFLVNTPQKRVEILELFRRLSKEVNVPICAKIRILLNSDGLADCEETVRFAKSLEDAGVSILEVHGRAEHRNKHAEIDTDILAAIVAGVGIPVIANGGVSSLADADSLRSKTGAAGIMIAQQLLTDPTTFDPHGPSSLGAFAREYLQLVSQYPVDIFSPRKHTFYFFVAVIKSHPGIENELKDTNNVEELLAFVEKYSTV